MKFTDKKKTICIFTLGAIFAIVLVFNNTLNLKIGNNETTNLKISKVSGRIHIDGNLGWSNAKTAGICTGLGTSNDPYIIEDLVIDGGGSGSCIWIENSNAYFKIENCTLYNSGGNDGDAGIILLNVRNGQLLNNSASNNWVGIHLNYCENNVISGNTVTNNLQTGISIPDCLNTLVSENNVKNNGLLGIGLEGNSHYNLILNNRVSNSGADGISMGYCNYNNFSGNILDNNPTGIYIDGGVNNLILGNKISNGSYGMGLWNISNCSISNNSVEAHERGISLEFCDSTNISGNSINDNYYGISVISSFRNSIVSNVFSNNDVGILLDELSMCNEVYSNEFSANIEDIRDSQLECNSFPLEIVLAIVIPTFIIATVIAGIVLKKRRASKDEVARYHKLKELENQSIDDSD